MGSEPRWFETDHVNFPPHHEFYVSQLLTKTSCSQVSYNGLSGWMSLLVRSLFSHLPDRKNQTQLLRPPPFPSPSSPCIAPSSVTQRPDPGAERKDWGWRQWGRRVQTAGCNCADLDKSLLFDHIEYRQLRPSRSLPCQPARSSRSRKPR